MLSNPLTQMPEWLALQAHQDEIKALHMRDLFASDPARADKFTLSLDEGLYLDYSKHRITEATLPLLFQLARACGIEEYRDQMFAGAPLNVTENRSVLHTALRGSTKPDLLIEGENVTDFVDETLELMRAMSDKIRSDNHYTDIVNIGVGGSDLGVRMVCEALSPSFGNLRIHFISNIDGDDLCGTLAPLDLDKTLFIIASKSFSTLETLANARVAWDMTEKAIGKNKVAQNFIAVTADKKSAQEFGILEENILPLRDWIGGRFSLWSALGLPIAIGAGFEVFKDLLKGAAAMDRHFQNAPLEQNMPVIMAVLGLWYRNFWDFRVQALVPYSQKLQAFPNFIQQLDMESNGKGSDLDGQRIDYATGSVILGGIGSDSQHAFFQLLHQGRDIIPVDFILIAQAEHDLKSHHTQLLSNALAQSKALMQGQDNKSEPHRHFSGNRPSSTLILDRLSPHHLGQLLALYEHKVFVQGALWNINSFDQWGVELGKTLAKRISAHEETDSSTAALLKKLGRASHSI